MKFILLFWENSPCSRSLFTCDYDRNANLQPYFPFECHNTRLISCKQTLRNAEKLIQLLMSVARKLKAINLDLEIFIAWDSASVSDIKFPTRGNHVSGVDLFNPSKCSARNQHEEMLSSVIRLSSLRTTKARLHIPPCYQIFSFNPFIILSHRRAAWCKAQ